MTARLDYVVARHLDKAVRTHYPILLWHLAAKSNWRGRRHTTFRLSLPRQIRQAVMVLAVMDDLRRTTDTRSSRSADLIFGKLTISLGLPFRGQESGSFEEDFVKTLKQEPHDLPAWLAYADWLEDNGVSDRAAVVRAWTGPELTPSRWGVVLLAMGENRTSSAYRR